MTRRDIRATRRDARRAGGRPAVAGDFELTPAVEAAIDALALAGRPGLAGAAAARNELYEALGLKTARFLAPYRRRHLALGEFADIEQEAFLVFARLVADWRGEGSFARYFLGFFPWRLRHAVAAHERRWPRERLAPLDDASPAHGVGEGIELDLATQFGPLEEWERRLLTLRLLEDRPLEEVAPLLGWSRRTAFRRWRELLGRLEGRLADGREGGRAGPRGGQGRPADRSIGPVRASRPPVRGTAACRRVDLLDSTGENA